MKYSEFLEKQREELDAFPKAFAFSSEQLEEAKRELGVASDDELSSLGCGVLIRKSDVESWKALMESWNKQRLEEVRADTTGKAFISDMFYDAISETETFIDGDFSYALAYAGIPETMLKLENVANGWKHAMRRIKKAYIEYF